MQERVVPLFIQQTESMAVFFVLLVGWSFHKNNRKKGTRARLLWTHGSILKITKKHKMKVTCVINQ